MKFNTNQILKLIKEGKKTTKEIIISKFKFKPSEARTSNSKYSRYYIPLRIKLMQMEKDGLISRIANAGEYELYLKK